MDFIGMQFSAMLLASARNEYQTMQCAYKKVQYNLIGIWNSKCLHFCLRATCVEKIPWCMWKSTCYFYYYSDQETYICSKSRVVLVIQPVVGAAAVQLKQRKDYWARQLLLVLNCL